MSLCRTLRPYYTVLRTAKSESTISLFRDRSFYKYFVDFQSRWRDNDAYGYINTVVYGEWIDTVVDRYLIEKCSLTPSNSSLLSFIASFHCQYYAPISYPATVSAGLFVKRIGNSSVDYIVGIFENSHMQKAAAVGGLTHVFVDSINQRPQPIDSELRKQLLAISNINSE